MRRSSQKVIELEGSKSILNRILVISTLMDSPVRFSRTSTCADIKTMISNLERIEFQYQKCEKYFEISKSNQNKKNINLFIEDSGTAWRFLLARMAGWKNIKSTINVSDQLRNRPIKPLLAVLTKLGAEIDSDSFPMVVIGKQLAGGEVVIDADISSQFISALLLIAPLYKNDLVIKLSGKLVSSPYLKMTMKIMQDFGISTSWKNNEIRFPADQKYHYNGVYEIEPDYSSSCYFWAMGALSKEPIFTNKYNRTSLQPDYGFLRILREMGAEIEIKPDAISVRKKQLNGIKINMKEMPDQVPTIAVLAIFADSLTMISGIEHLRYKESDRIAALIEEFEKLNVKIKYSSGILSIFPNTKLNTKILLNSHNDHRIAMALHILKFRYPEIQITETNCISKSYPNFAADVKSIFV
jgi:3-phosphoshikimate 1-carboxyvinyltransferase